MNSSAHERGRQGRGYCSAFAAGRASGGGGRRASAWGCASEWHRVPSHACRLFLKEAARIRRPAAVLCTDLASAFYSVLPELALGAILSSRKRDQVFDALGVAGVWRRRSEPRTPLSSGTWRRAGARWQRTSMRNPGFG